MSKENCRDAQCKDERKEKNLEIAREFCNFDQARRPEKNCDNCKR